MKRLIVVLILLMQVIGCSGQKNKKDESMEVKKITRSEFIGSVADIGGNQWKVTGKRPAIVDFYADWCGPCRSVAPIVAEIADEYKGRIDVYKVNIDEEQQLARELGIASIPTIFFIPLDGKPTVIRGAIPKQTFIETIDRVLLMKQK